MGYAGCANLPCRCRQFVTLVSRVLSLNLIQRGVDFLTEWRGNDAGAGVKDYSIFVSGDGQLFTSGLTNVPETSSRFNKISGGNLRLLQQSPGTCGEMSMNAAENRRQLILFPKIILVCARKKTGRHFLA